ncbi:tetratricopeptide repeat protein [Cohaesibacter marisflavi]|uniref:tetratricopeptide repeat protein n=1 Tax=Cohaesibacter marisflavi TaxID=655353 RepID=UPI0029C7666D|nr:hypothetical protein [Cohaesibacter marisflavi]
MDTFSLHSDSQSSITVFFANDNCRSKTCFVIFSSWAGRSLNTKIGGTDPLLREGFDVVCVQSNCDDWHQNIFPFGIEILKKYLDENYSDIRGYGSSMGAFGAILYADLLNFNSVLALSPQYTISAPFDKRWSLFDKRIKWKYKIEQSIKYSGEIHVFYDPLDIDAKHFELISRNFNKAKVYGYSIKFGSHPTTYYFNDGGKLKELLLSFAKGKCSVPSVDKSVNKTYLKSLSFEALKRNKPRLAKNLILKAISLGDERHSTYRHASNVCHRLNELETAVAFAEKAVGAKDNIDISHISHSEHLANMLRLAGDRHAAISIIDVVLSRNPERFTALTIKANILFASKEVEAAKGLFLRAIELGDERHSTYRQASNICNRLKEFEIAVLYARKAVVAKDNTVKSRINHSEHLADMLRMIGDFGGALEKIDGVLSQDSGRFTAYTTKARILLANLEFGEAKVSVLKAIELGDERHSTYRLVSNICNRLGDFEHAVEYAQKATEAKDNNATSRLNHLEHLAILLKGSGELEAALRVIDEVLFQDENRPSAYLTKANILLEMGALEENALWLVEKAIFIGDRRPSTYHKASELCRRIDDDECAEMYAKKAIEAHDNNGDSRIKHLVHLATLLKESGDLEAALTTIDEVLFQDENRSSARLTKANILLEMGELEKAKLQIVKAIALGDHRNSTYRQASEVAYSLRDFEDAVTYAKKAFDAKDNNSESRNNHSEHLANMMTAIWDSHRIVQD